MASIQRYAPLTPASYVNDDLFGDNEYNLNQQFAQLMERSGGSKPQQQNPAPVYQGFSPEEQGFQQQIPSETELDEMLDQHLYNSTAPQNPASEPGNQFDSLWEDSALEQIASEIQLIQFVEGIREQQNSPHGYPSPEEPTFHPQVHSELALPPAPQNPEHALREFTRPLEPENKNNRVKKSKAPSKRPVGKDSCDACKRSKIGCKRDENHTGCKSCQKKGIECTTTTQDKRTNMATRAAYTKAYEKCEKYQLDLQILAFYLCQRANLQPQGMAASSLTKDLDLDSRIYMCCGLNRNSNCDQKTNQVRLPPRKQDLIHPTLADGLKLSDLRNWFELLQQRTRSEVALLSRILVALTDNDPRVREQGPYYFDLYRNCYDDLQQKTAGFSIDPNHGVVNYQINQVDKIIAEHKR